MKTSKHFQQITRLFIIAGIFVINFSLYSSEIINPSQKKLPDWIKNTPKGKYYDYYNGVGTSGKSISDAKKLAISDAIFTIVMQGKIEIDSKIFTSTSENTISNGRNTNTTIRDSVISEVMIKGKSSYIIGLRSEEEHWHTKKSEKGLLYDYWILMKVPKPEYRGLKIPDQKGYGFPPVWRSVLIPGWGQFYKGEPKKGWRFLISETVFVSSFFVSNYFSQNYSRKAENETDYERRKFYNNWSNSSYTIGTVSGIVAGAIYFYNIFDSITSKGAKKYAQTHSKSLELFTTLDKNQVSVNITIKIGVNNEY